MVQHNTYSVADLYGSDYESNSLYKEDEKFSSFCPDNSKPQIINKIAKAALALCGIFWAGVAGLSLKYLLIGAPLFIAGAATPWGISVLAFTGFLTISAYFVHAMTSERGTC